MKWSQGGTCFDDRSIKKGPVVAQPKGPAKESKIGGK